MDTPCAHGQSKPEILCYHSGMSLEWNGRAVRRDVFRACVKGLNETMGRAVVQAKQRPRMPVLTGKAQGSVRIVDLAHVEGSLVKGSPGDRRTSTTSGIEARVWTPSRRWCGGLPGAPSPHPQAAQGDPPMIEAVVDWLRTELDMKEVYTYEIPKEVDLPARAITLARSPGGTPPRGSFRRDALNVWVYGKTSRTPRPSIRSAPWPSRTSVGLRLRAIAVGW